MYNLLHIPFQNIHFKLVHLYISSIKEFPAATQPKPCEKNIASELNLAVDMSDKAKRRFFNAALKDIYDACVLPTENEFGAPNAIVSTRFEETATTASNSSWTNTTREAPASMAYLHGGSHFLSSPFHGFDPEKPRLLQISRKKSRTSGVPVTQDASDGASDDKKRKLNNVQLRQEALGGHFRAYKVRMLPNAAQRRELERCFKVARHAYNWANECVREGFARPNHYELRSRYRANKVMDDLDFANTSATRVSSNIASRAIKQLTDAYATNFRKRAKDPGHTFEVKFRGRKKTPTEVILIDKDNAGPDREFKKKTSTLLRFAPGAGNIGRGRAECLAFLGNNLANVGGIRLQDSEKVIDKILKEGNRLHEDAKIRWDKRTGTYHFIYLHVIPQLEDPDPEFEHKRILATDPGCTPFQEWYSPTSGNYGELLVGARAVLRSKCLKLDALQSRIDRRRQTPASWKNTRRRQRESSYKRHRLQRYRSGKRITHKLARDRRRLHGWIEAAHYSAANFLLQDYDIIVQPVLQIRKLTQKASGRFQNKISRAMYTWSHYNFRQRLKSAAARYPGRHVYETSEPGTSKTCTHCGFWKADLKCGDKRYDCSRCGVQVDRQLAGARNNFFAAYGMAVGMGWDGLGG